MPNKTFRTDKKLVLFLHILAQEHFTGNQLEEIIKRAEKAENKAIVIEPYTAGFHANHQANRLINKRKRYE